MSLYVLIYDQTSTFSNLPWQTKSKQCLRNIKTHHGFHELCSILTPNSLNYKVDCDEHISHKITMLVSIYISKQFCGGWSTMTTICNSLHQIDFQVHLTCRNPSLGLTTKARAYKVAGQEGSSKVMPPGTCCMLPGNHSKNWTWPQKSMGSKFIGFTREKDTHGRTHAQFFGDVGSVGEWARDEWEEVRNEGEVQCTSQQQALGPLNKQLPSSNNKPSNTQNH
jgi:hypothetical protein